MEWSIWLLAQLVERWGYEAMLEKWLAWKVSPSENRKENINKTEKSSRSIFCGKIFHDDKIFAPEVLPLRFWPGGYAPEVLSRKFCPSSFAPGGFLPEFSPRRFCQGGFPPEVLLQWLCPWRFSLGGFTLEVLPWRFFPGGFSRKVLQPEVLPRFCPLDLPWGLPWRFSMN